MVRPRTIARTILRNLNHYALVHRQAEFSNMEKQKAPVRGPSLPTSEGLVSPSEVKDIVPITEVGDVEQRRGLRDEDGEEFSQSLVGVEVNGHIGGGGAIHNIDYNEPFICFVKIIFKLLYAQASDIGRQRAATENFFIFSLVLFPKIQKMQSISEC